MRAAEREHAVLALWDGAAGLAGVDRDDALLAADGPPPRGLGARNAALLRLRARLFGAALPLCGDCPRCGATAEFGVDCAGLAAAIGPAADDDEHALEHDGWRVAFRLPDVDDLRAVGGADSDAAFASALLERCLVGWTGPDGADGPWPAAVAEALSARLDALDPGAALRFDVGCPECGTAWSAGVDVGAVVWAELQSRAERLLIDVDALARAYGWTEDQVLALGPTRRAAYLQLVGAGG